MSLYPLLRSIENSSLEIFLQSSEDTDESFAEIIEKEVIHVASHQSSRFLLRRVQ